MTGFVNDPARLRDEALAGFVVAHADLVVGDAQGRFVRRRASKQGKVAVVSGGGSGHEPLHLGFVGLGMLDAACPGQIFTAPTPDQIAAAIEAVDAGKGVLLVTKNYAGDIMNFDMAAELTRSTTASVLVDDDVSIERTGRAAGRRGVAGTLVVEKIVGAAAERGDDLAACKALGDRINGRTRSMGVALKPCTLPATGASNFVLGPDEMEMGVGIHGESGRSRVRRAPADAIARDLLGQILADLEPRAGEEALLIVNGFGATPLVELYLMVNSAKTLLDRAGLPATRFLTGSYVTSLDMAGCSITVAALDDDLRALWDAPVCTAALRW